MGVRDNAYTGGGDNFSVWNSEQGFKIGTSRENDTWYTYQLIPDLDEGIIHVYRNDEHYTIPEPQTDPIDGTSIVLSGGTCWGCGGVGKRRYEYITASGVSSIQEPLQNLIDGKQAFINLIQTRIGEELDSIDPETSVDQEANDLVADIESDQSSATSAELDQYEEALERMVSGERVSEAAVANPKRIIPTHAKNIFDFALMGVSKSVGKVAGVVGKWLLDTQVAKFIANRIHSKAGNTLDSELGKGVVDGSRLAGLTSKVDDIESQWKNTFSSLSQNDREKITGAFAELGTNAVYNTVMKTEFPGIVSGVNSIQQDSVAFIENELYSDYYLSSNVFRAGEPEINDFQLPDFQVTIDVPDRIYEEPVTVPPDGTEIPSTIPFDTPISNVLNPFRRVLDILIDVLEIKGVNGTLDDQVANMREQLESQEGLAIQDENTRAELKNTLNTLSDEATFGAEYLLQLLDFITTEAFDLDLDEFSIVGGVVLASIAAGALAASPGLIAFLLAFWALYTAVQNLLVILQTLTGWGYLSLSGLVNLAGTEAILNNDLESLEVN